MTEQEREEEYFQRIEERRDEERQLTDDYILRCAQVRAAESRVQTLTGTVEERDETIKALAGSNISNYERAQTLEASHRRIREALHRMAYGYVDWTLNSAIATALTRLIDIATVTLSDFPTDDAQEDHDVGLQEERRQFNERIRTLEAAHQLVVDALLAVRAWHQEKLLKWEQQLEATPLPSDGSVVDGHVRIILAVRTGDAELAIEAIDKQLAALSDPPAAITREEEHR